MIEPFKTSGSSTYIVKLPSSFNAGVGGDRIENVLYRLDVGLLDILRLRRSKLRLLAVRTNNIPSKRELKASNLERYEILLKALPGSSEGSRVLACEVFRREHIGNEVVGKSNRLLKERFGDSQRGVGRGEFDMVECS